jgi:cyclohexanone monooxygenase
MASSAPPAPPLDVAVVGVGLGGLYALHKLRGMGMTARGYEAGSGIGGTWFWNRYPGARCDIESLEYSYSFSEDLQNEWHWPERYATQPVILDYINHVADKFDLRRDIQLNTRIAEARFDAAARLWTLRTKAGEVIQARHVIMATGNLSTPRVPDFKGIEGFQGQWYHTGLWPAEGVDFSGQTVGVVGTGSTAIQMIPLIAAQAKHLYVFQRTPNFVLPARNAPMDPERERRHRATYAERLVDARQTAFGVSGVPIPTQSALAVPEDERRANYEAMWQAGGTIPLLNCYNDFLVDERANDTAADFVRKKIRDVVKDPKVAALLTPQDHPIGSKRLCLDTGYYETFNRDNVTLVDVRSDPIAEITPDGVRLQGGTEYRVDSLAFATGFDAMTGALREIDIRGAEGQALAEAWEGGPLTYLGLMVAGFPNLFMVTGPGSPGVKSQMIHSIEQHVDWITDCLAALRAKGLTTIQPTEAAQADWVDHVNKVADRTLYPRANSWYVGANIPGKPRVFMPYVGGVAAYRRKCDEVAAKGYAGFVLAD